MLCKRRSWLKDDSREGTACVFVCVCACVFGRWAENSKEPGTAGAEACTRDGEHGVWPPLGLATPALDPTPSSLRARGLDFPPAIL